LDTRLTFNPELRSKGLPDNMPEHPVGTKDEAEGLGLETAIYATCSKPVRGVNRGCQFFHLCPMSYKGKTLEEGGGPRRHAFEVIMPGKAIVRYDSVCYNTVPKISDVEDNKGAIRIIADEGETYEKVEGIYIKTFVDDETNQTVKVPAIDGEQFLPNVNRGEMLVEKEVAPFVRAAENHEIATDLVTANVIAKEKERIRGESFPAALGVEAGGTPLDKRNRRSRKSEGSSERGGSGA
jgi:hypothetical protein